MQSTAHELHLLHHDNLILCKPCTNKLHSHALFGPTAFGMCTYVARHYASSAWSACTYTRAVVQASNVCIWPYQFCGIPPVHGLNSSCMVTACVKAHHIIVAANHHSKHSSIGYTALTEQTKAMQMQYTFYIHLPGKSDVNSLKYSSYLWTLPLLSLASMQSVLVKQQQLILSPRQPLQAPPPFRQ